MIQTQQDVLHVKLDQFRHSEFEAGLRSLQQAQRSQNEVVHLLREARQRFNQAASLETGLRQAYVFLALAVCHHRLGDIPNAENALRDALGVTIMPREEIKERAIRAAAVTVNAVSSTLNRFGRIGEAGGQKLSGIIDKDHKTQTAKETVALVALQEFVRAFLTIIE